MTRSKKKKKKKAKKKPKFNLLMPPRYTSGVLTNDELKANQKRSMFEWRTSRKLQGLKQSTFWFPACDKASVERLCKALIEDWFKKNPDLRRKRDIEKGL